MKAIVILILLAILISLGSEDVKLKQYGTENYVDSDLLKSVLDTLAQLTRFTTTLETTDVDDVPRAAHHDPAAGDQPPAARPRRAL